MSIEGERLLLQIDAMLAKSNKDEDVSEIQYSFDRVDLSNSVSTLGTISILVKAKNLSDESRKNIEALLSDNAFRERIVDIQGSNSIKEDIELAIIQVLQGKEINLPKHTKKPPEIKKVPLRGVKGQFFNIANLLIILNQRLFESIKDNMGKGSARSILNYRTGRFASSVSVEKLTIDRAGQLTAFYNYMKYPYQTFEPGFVQGDPKSRDPKLLIAKSIRQIASEIVTNRLKAVLV